MLIVSKLIKNLKKENTMKILIFVLATGLSLTSFASDEGSNSPLDQKKTAIELALQNFTDPINDKVATCAGLDYSDSNSYVEIKDLMDKAVEYSRMPDLMVLEYCIAQVWKDL